MDWLGMHTAQPHQSSVFLVLPWDGLGDDQDKLASSPASCLIAALTRFGNASCCLPIISTGLFFFSFFLFKTRATAHPVMEQITSEAAFASLGTKNTLMAATQAASPDVTVELTESLISE